MKVQLKATNTSSKKQLFKKIVFKKTLLLSFLKVFFLFFFSMLPIALHSIIPLFIDVFKYGENLSGVNGTIVAQSINYSQPMLFFSINIIVLIIVQVSFLIKSYREKAHFEKNKQKIINTGMYLLIFLSLSIAILFVSIMMLYTEFSISGFGEKSASLKLYSRLYIAIMAVYILFAGISSYFLFILLESGIKLSYTTAIELFFSILDILLSVIFLLYFHNLSPVIRISLGTLISTIIKFIVVGIIYKVKIVTWSFKETKLDTFFAKEIFRVSWMLSTFMLVYAFNIILQMIFINLLSKTTHSYIFYKDGDSLIILSRIIIFSLLNLLVIIPKSLGRAANLSSIKPIDNFNISINQFRESHKYNYYGITIFLIICFILYFFMGNIVDGLFANQLWTHQIIPLEEQLTIPFAHGSNITYLDVIRKFILNGFIISIFAQAIINFTINIRIFLFFNFERSVKLFVITISTFIISYGLGSYFLGVYFQRYLPGMIGFSLAQLIYGLLSISTSTYFYFKISNKFLNNKLEKLDQQKLKSLWQYKSILKYAQERKEKIKICLNN